MGTNTKHLVTTFLFTITSLLENYKIEFIVMKNHILDTPKNKYILCEKLQFTRNIQCINGIFITLERDLWMVLNDHVKMYKLPNEYIYTYCSKYLPKK